MVVVNILGTRYLIEKKRIEDDPLLGEQSLGYTDESIKRIVVACMTKDTCELKDTSFVTREVIRHEIIHAFLIESGLGDLMTHVESGHDEQMIDWFARQSGKIFKAFEEADVLDKANGEICGFCKRSFIKDGRLSCSLDGMNVNYMRDACRKFERSEDE